MTEMEEILEIINEAFDDNFESLRFESGHSITYDVKERAKLQVLLYYIRLKEIAEKVTETEVKLYLPGQKTKNNKKYSIEGIVDIVSEGNKVVMYDIKTHEDAVIKNDLEKFEQQLNIYAHIWQNLRKQQLDETAIIATAPPSEVYRKTKEFVKGRRMDVLVHEYKAIEKIVHSWNPVIPIDFHQDKVDQTIEEFSEVVDKIEERNFAPPPVSKLKERMKGSNRQFASQICKNCDGRFSCTSWRMYARTLTQGQYNEFKKYLFMLADENEQDEFKDQNLMNQTEL